MSKYADECQRCGERTGPVGDYCDDCERKITLARLKRVRR